MSLSEQIIGLCDPTPNSRTLDWFDDDDNDETKAKLCNYSENDTHNEGLTKSTLRKNRFETDPKYAGKPVSRKALGKQWGLNTSTRKGSENDVEENQFQNESDDSYGNEDDLEEEFEDDLSEGDELEEESSGAEEEEIPEKRESKEFDKQSLNEDSIDDLVMSNEDVTANLRESIAEDLEKGKAVKNQISIWDGLLEGRVRLQKVLPLINKLPQGEMMEVFENQGKDAIRNSLKHSRTELTKLLHSLLDLQKQLLLRNSTTKHIILGSDQEEVKNDSDNEEIPSDFSDAELSPNDQSDTGTSACDLKPSKRSSRQHNINSEWKNGSHEKYIEKVHQQFAPYRNDTITKWNEKLKLASGKITSKAFLHFDRSVMNHINYVLQDKQRLRKRTQLKRTSYNVIGQLPTAKRMATEKEESASVKDYDQEIFDDDDFYHQLLKELIDRKTSQHSTDDPIELGRQWLELQKLRAKVKKNVDTKASKGRKLRYDVHQKLSNFMTPIDKGQTSNSARNDLFSSLFGSRSIAVANL